MAFEADLITIAEDPTRADSDFTDLLKPAITTSGAIEVLGGEALTGPMTGQYVLATRWESLSQWADATAAINAQMADSAELNEMRSRYQTVQRILTQDVHEAGSPSGAFMSASRYSVTALPEGLDHAAELLLGAGANGVRIVSVLAGGDMSGQLIGSTFYDSLDTMPVALAATLGDSKFVESVQTAGGQLQSRTVFRLVG